MNSASKPNSPTSFFIYGILLGNEYGKRLCLEASWSSRVGLPLLTLFTGWQMEISPEGNIAEAEQ